MGLSPRRAGVRWSTTPVAACPCWGDRGIAQEPNQTEVTCVKQVTAAERLVAAPTTMSCGVSGSLARFVSDVQ